MIVAVVVFASVQLIDGPKNCREYEDIALGGRICRIRPWVAVAHESLEISVRGCTKIQFVVPSELFLSTEYENLVNWILLYMSNLVTLAFFMLDRESGSTSNIPGVTRDGIGKHLVQFSA